MSFEAQLEIGRMGEKLVAAWAQERGWYIIPSYEFSGKGEDKAPRLHGLATSYVLPDLDLARDGKRKWLEVKTFGYAPMNRSIGETVHGISRRLYEHYLKVQEITGSRVYLGVLEISTGELLIGQLDTLTVYPCMCIPCDRGKPAKCRAPLRRGAYFARGELKTYARFDDSDLSGLRAAHRSAANSALYAEAGHA